MARGLTFALLASVTITLAAAGPVIQSPTEQIYGCEFVGRHADAYTVIAQLVGRGTPGTYAQSLTDVPGWWLARGLHPVAAYNSASSSASRSPPQPPTCSRIGSRSPAAAVIASLIFTFAPLRLAHAAYHPHIVQTQWRA